MTTRRNFVQHAVAAAGIAAAPAVVAVAAVGPDPIYAVIEAHHAALKAWNEALSVQGAFEKKWFAERKGSRKEKTSAHLAAEAHAEALSEIEGDAHRALIDTATTLPGTLAAIRYAMGYYNGECELFPGRYHELFDEESLVAFIEAIGDRIEAALPVLR